MENAVVGVRFQEAGKIYYFEPGGYGDDLTVGSYVVVETSRGVELGRVVIAPGQVLSAELTEPLKSIIRPAGPDDVDRADELKEQAREATELARARARALDLPMKVVSAQYTLDGSRLTVFFTSEDRVDFRDLVRDLGHQIHAQVQLRQIGPRDQAKLIGGYGRCGRRLCCTSWLTAFPAISIKMAKEQNLPLNPTKISGQCGRLLCCLSYENDVYKQLKAELPRPDSWLSTPSGNARVVAVNAIKQIVTLQMETFQIVEITVAQLGLDRGVVRPLPAEGAVAVDEVHAIPSATEEAAADPHAHPDAPWAGLLPADHRALERAGGPGGGRPQGQRGEQPAGRRGDTRNGAMSPSQRSRGQGQGRPQSLRNEPATVAKGPGPQQSGESQLHSEQPPEGAVVAGEPGSHKRRRRRRRGGGGKG